MKMYTTNTPMEVIKEVISNGFVTDARSTSRLTGFILSAASSTHNGAPVTSGAGSQPFGRKHRF